MTAGSGLPSSFQSGCNFLRSNLKFSPASVRWMHGLRPLSKYDLNPTGVLLQILFFCFRNLPGIKSLLHITLCLWCHSRPPTAVTEISPGSLQDLAESNALLGCSLLSSPIVLMESSFSGGGTPSLRQRFFSSL